MFADEGYDVYVINDPNFDFSRGFNIAPFTAPTEGAPPADPEAERAWQRDVWRRWGFGDSEGNPYPDTRFPTDCFDTFEANYPYVSDAGRSYSDAVVSLLDIIGPAMVMAHSAGASTAVKAATARLDLTLGFVMVEPAGPPDANDFPALAGMSMLGIYGDYIDSRNQGGRKEATEAAAVLFEQYGGMGEVISLPEDHQVYGNTHLMMQDDNNDFIADLILDWLANPLSQL
jgi:pimeloyl-ACP methyl ester carboxylesterase